MNYDKHNNQEVQSFKFIIIVSKRLFPMVEHLINFMMLNYYWNNTFVIWISNHRLNMSQWKYKKKVKIKYSESERLLKICKLW